MNGSQSASQHRGIVGHECWSRSADRTPAFGCAKARSWLAHGLAGWVSQGARHAAMIAVAKLATPHDADTFLRLLGDRHTFQTFDDTGRRANLSRVLHGTLAEHAHALSALNARGAGVFVMVNAGDGKGRRRENVRAVRALFVDLDGAPLGPVMVGPLAPHCIVETSPGRWHAYWCVADCALEDFKTLQKALAARSNADPKVCDLARVMRVPGFDHRKRQPFRSHIVEWHDRALYSLTELRGAFGFQASAADARTPRTLPQGIPEGERNDTLFSLARGFAKRGHDFAGVNQRLQRINAERCDPPLCATEVDSIATNAHAYGSDGFAMLPHALLDSPKWKALGPPEHDIVLRAFRRFDGGNNGRIALSYSDFARLPGFANSAAFYQRRARVLVSGILIQTHQGGLTRNGRQADLFAIADRFLPRGQR
jgi:hypothetical protein